MALKNDIKAVLPTLPIVKLEGAPVSTTLEPILWSSRKEVPVGAIVTAPVVCKVADANMGHKMSLDSRFKVPVCEGPPNCALPCT